MARMRAGEATRMKGSDVDAPSGMMRVPGKKGRKDRAERWFPVPRLGGGLIGEEGAGPFRGPKEVVFVDGHGAVHRLALSPPFRLEALGLGTFGKA